MPASASLRTASENPRARASDSSASSQVSNGSGSAGSSGGAGSAGATGTAPCAGTATVCADGYETVATAAAETSRMSQRGRIDLMIVHRVKPTPARVRATFTDHEQGDTETPRIIATDGGCHLAARRC